MEFPCSDLGNRPRGNSPGVLLGWQFWVGNERIWDFNAANNIKNRVRYPRLKPVGFLAIIVVSITVLCNSLLKQLDNGVYEPKNLKREKVKEVLLSFRRNLQNVGSECIECSLTTFDYV